MNEFLQLFNINNTFFTILNYPISYIEFVGTLFNLASVWLVAKKKIINWPIGIVGVILFGILFYQINLYADLIEQGYYLVTSIIGWYLWAHTKKPNDSDADIVVERNSHNQNITWVAGIIVVSLLAGWALRRVHLWLPAIFPEPAALPYLDAGTTIMSFAAMILMIKRRVESWVIWILVDIIAIGLYWYKAVPFIALLYLIFLGIAINGFISWRDAYKKEQS
jgi:nicotinamide mononucleotide transporter